MHDDALVIVSVLLFAIRNRYPTFGFTSSTALLCCAFVYLGKSLFLFIFWKAQSWAVREVDVRILISSSKLDMRVIESSGPRFLRAICSALLASTPP